jgi:hypothetical protein
MISHLEYITKRIIVIFILGCMQYVAWKALTNIEIFETEETIGRP